MKTQPIQNVLVTGGGSGLGRAVAQRLARVGKRLFVADLDLQGARETVQQMGREGSQAEPFPVDVSEEDSVAALFQALRARADRLDMLVHTAGIMGETRFLQEMSLADWQKIQSVNVDGTFLCSRETVGWMQETGGGRIVLFSSVAGLTPTPGAAAYSTAKGGLISLTRSLASETAKLNIRVNAVAPGYMQTPMLEHLPNGFAEFIQKKTPLKRLGSVEEISGLVEFLASPEADFFTGQVLSPNGGLVM